MTRRPIFALAFAAMALALVGCSAESVTAFETPPLIVYIEMLPSADAAPTAPVMLASTSRGLPSCTARHASPRALAIRGRDRQ